METSTLILLTVGGGLAAVGGIMLLVAAFRASIGWGLASMFLPFANLVFVIAHWAEARTGFLVSLAGGVFVGIGIATSPTVRTLAMQFHSLAPATLPISAFHAGKSGSAPTPTPIDLTAQIEQHRTRLETLEAKFAQDGGALAEQFRKLTDRRNALATTDAAAVNAFNVEAADYQSRNEARRAARLEIDALHAELDTFLEQRARQASAAESAAVAAKRVVMYTTATCPACKMAKTYFAQKGVRYEERDVNHSPEARAEFQKLGGRGVPLILVGKDRMEGFSAQRLDQLL